MGHHARNPTTLARCATLALLLVPSSIAHSAPDVVTFAVNYCATSRAAIRLSENRNFLCFDGQIKKDLDLAPFHRLNDGGYFVVRSQGGHPISAAQASDILLEKNATVIVRDYCLSACANYMFVATNVTYVMNRTIIAWHLPPAYHDVVSPRARQTMMSALTSWTPNFFRKRGIDGRFINQPQTPYTKNMLDLAIRVSPSKGYIFWMWNPKNYGDYFKRAIIYDHYPESQDEVDAIVRRFGGGLRVIYDPDQRISLGDGIMIAPVNYR